MNKFLVIIRMTKFDINLRKNCEKKGLTKNQMKKKFRVLYLQIYDAFKLIRITSQAACHGKTEHGIFVKFKKKRQNFCRPHCWCHHLRYSVPPALHCTIWCRSTFGPRGPGLSLLPEACSSNGIDNRRQR